MPSYFGYETTQNKVLWVLFFSCFIAGAVMVPIGWAKILPCAHDYNACRGRGVSSSWEAYCRSQQETCRAHWGRVWAAGIFLLGFAMVFLFIFSCCSRPPPQYCTNTTPTAVALQQYPQGAYQPYSPAPGPYYVGSPVTGQPVMYVAVPQNGQPGMYYYPPPPPGPYPPPPPGEGATLYASPMPQQAGVSSPYTPPAPPAGAYAPYPPPAPQDSARIP